MGLSKGWSTDLAGRVYFWNFSSNLDTHYFNFDVKIYPFRACLDLDSACFHWIFVLIFTCSISSCSKHCFVTFTWLLYGWWKGYLRPQFHMTQLTWNADMLINICTLNARSRTPHFGRFTYIIQINRCTVLIPKIYLSLCLH